MFLRSFPQFLRFLAQSDTPTFRVLGLARQPYFQNHATPFRPLRPQLCMTTTNSLRPTRWIYFLNSANLRTLQKVLGIRLGSGGVYFYQANPLWPVKSSHISGLGNRTWSSVLWFLEAIGSMTTAHRLLAPLSVIVWGAI